MTTPLKLACFCVIVFIGAIATLSFNLRASSRIALAADMVEQACHDYSVQIETSGRPDVQQILGEIYISSRAVCWKNEQGIYTDPWGNQIVIVLSGVSGRTCVVGTSFGPDGIKRTKDDIVVACGERVDAEQWYHL